MCAKSPQSCPTLCDPKDYSLPGSSVNMKQNGKVKKLDKWMSHELITNQKIIIIINSRFKVSSYSMQQ